MLLRQHPEDVSRSLSRAMDAMGQSTSIGLHVVEADTALRDSLALLPNLLKRRKLPDESIVALSPDGQHYATLSDYKLRVYESGKATPLLVVPHSGLPMVALSSNPVYVAAVTKGGVEIFDMKHDAPVRLVKLEAGVSAEHLAISPGGRYLALSFDVGKDLGRFSKVRVLDAETGKTVKCFDDDHDTPTSDVVSKPCGNLNMVIGDIAFGPTGRLAVGGTYNSPHRGAFPGRVVIWALPLTTSDGKPEPELTNDSFSDPETIPLRSGVEAVAPGTDDTDFATDTGVWKRMTGQATYELVASMPYKQDDAYIRVNKLAFSPDGRRVTLARTVVAPGDSADLMEVWDATGYWDSAHMYHSEEVAYAGFQPGAQRVVTMTREPAKEE
jgi:hypothetical protein